MVEGTPRKEGLCVVGVSWLQGGGGAGRGDRKKLFEKNDFPFPLGRGGVWIQVNWKTKNGAHRFFFE